MSSRQTDLLMFFFKLFLIKITNLVLVRNRLDEIYRT